MPKPIFLLYYEVITKEHAVQLVTSDIDKLIQEWKSTKEFEDESYFDIYVDVWKDESLKGTIVWSDQSEYSIINQLSVYF